MKVLHVISDENIGGAGVLLCNLLRHFDKDEVQSLVALPMESDLEERVRSLGVHTVALSHACDRLSAASVWEISRLIRLWHADLVHANAAVCARLAARNCHVPSVHTRHCCFGAPPTSPPIRYTRGAINAFLCDRAIATADSAAEDLCALGIPSARIRVVINGSDPVREVGETELRAFCKRYAIPKDAYVIGICARLEACKGQDTFLRAAQILLEQHPTTRFCFLLVGSGTKETALRALAESLGIAESVRFTGFVADMAPVYRLLRINVNCSRGTETSCLALSEGMSAGVPMVVSDYGGNPAMLRDSLAGFLFPTDDAQTLAALLGRIVSNPTLETQMRCAARERYERYYTAERMTRQVTGVYRELVGKK